MIRRPRFNLKPNIRPGGRGPGPAAPAPTEPLPEPADSASQHVSESPAGCGSPSAVKVDALTPEEKPRVLNEKETVSGNETQQAKVTPAPFQRRKRISTLPNLAKPRVSAATPSSQKPPSVETPSLQTSPGTPVKNEVTPPEEKLKPLCSPRSPTPQGPHPPLPDKKTPVPLIPQFSPYKKPLKQQEVTPVKAAEPTSLEELCPLKERPSQELSINGEPVYRTKPTPAKKIVGDLERERLRRAQKLRDLLRDELRKERRVWKEKHPVIIIDPSIEPERSKMTMRDFVHFIPVNNPMTSSAEERRNGEKSLPAESQLSTPEPKNLVDEDDDLDEAENDSQLVVPRVKVAEDGSIILDEESLTVEVSRAKAAIVEENDPIFERGSTTTYSSFRKSSHAKPWSDQETEMFFLAISMVGTDFSMIGQLFPHRERTEIKNKFKREERANGWRIDKAFREKKAFDFEFFAKLLERALEAKNKKQKSPRAKKPQEKKSPKPRKKKDKKADEQKSCVSDGDGVNLSEGEAMDSRTAEKENEESPCLKETSACLDSVPAKKKRKRKKEADSVVSEEEKCLKKGAKSRKKNKSTSGEDDHASDAAEGPSEREVTGNEEQLNTEGIEVPEKKRRGRKRKDDAKVSEKELQPEEGADTAPITKKSKARGKRKSVTFEKNDDVESVEDALDSSKGACTTSEEIVGNDGNDSVLLFSEDCENALESGFLTSTQMSASDAPAFEVLQASDLTINDESKLTPPCDRQEPTSQQSANQEEPTSEEASDLMNGTDQDSAPKEPDSPTKDTKAQIPHPVRGRLVKPKPNLAKFSGKERAAGKVESSSDTKNDPSTHSEEVPLISNTSDAKSSEGDIENEAAAGESELLSAKPAAVVRGGLQSPKPNLTKSSARKESVAGAEEKRDNREAASEHPNNISPYSKESPSHAGKHADKQMDVSNVDVHSSQGEPASVTVSNPPPEHSHTSDLEHPLSKTSDSSLADVGKERSQMGNAQTEKVPDQTVRRGLLRPRPNLAKAPPRNKPIQSLISEQTDQTGQISGEAGIASASTERVETPGLEKKTEEEMKTEEPPVSEDERKRCPTKATPLAQSRFQKPRPNLSRPPTRSGNQEKTKDTQEQNMEQSTGDASRTSLHQTDGQHISTKEGSQTIDVTVDGNITLDASSVPVHITPPSDACSLAGSVPDRLDHDCASGRSLVDKSLASQDKCVKSPVKPTPLACGRFARLKPNIGSASSARTRKANVEPSVQSIEPVADEPSLKSHSPGRDTPGFEKREDQQREVSVTDNHVPDCLASVCFPCQSPENSRSEAGHLESAPAHEAPEEIMKDSTLEEASVKPEPVTQPFPVRGRLQRPKPNIQRAAAKRGALVPTGAAKVEAPVHVQRNIDKKLSPDGPVSAPCASDCKQALPSNIQPIKAGPSAILKPAILKRGRFQGQNLLGAAAKRDLPASQSSDGESKEMGPSAISTNTMSNISMCEDAKSPLTCTLSAETQNNQLDESTAVTTLVEDVEDEPGEGDKRPNKDDSRETATKPAEQRRGRLMRPKPNLGRVASRKESRAEGEAEKRVKIELNESSQEKDGKEQLPDNENHFSDSSGIKGNACATSIIVSPKKRQSSTTERKQVCAIEDASLGSRESQNNLSRAPQIGLSAGQQTVIPSIEVDSASAKGDPDSAVTQRSRYGRQLKKPVIPPPSVPSKASENKTEGSGKEKSVRSTKTTSSKSKSANSISKTAKGKTTLVTLRASQEDDEEEEEDVETEFGDEDYNLAPDMVNQAPVFVPFSLRSPKPVTSEIEETVEELELPMEILEVQSIDDHERCVGTTGLLPGAQAPAALSSMSEPDNTDHIDGSTEAAMTLISMRNPAYQPIADTSGASAQENQNDLKTLSEKQAPTFLTSADQDYKGHMQNARSGINDCDVPSIALGTTGRLEEVSTGIILMQCLQSQSPDSRFEVQSVNPLDGSCGAEFEQVTYPGIQDPEPCYSVSQNDETSGNIDKSVNPEMETTFILTLVEIPLNSEYQYPGETCNPELPAPVMVSTASAHTVFSSETPSTEIVAGCDSFTSAGSETATGALNQIPWKTQQSSSDGDGTGPATKKVLLQEHLQENQPTGTELKVVQDGSTPAVASSQEVTLQTADIQSEGVAPTVNLTREEEPASFSAGRDSLGNNIHLPTELSALPSKTSLTRPGKKPLGILGLVCQEKGKRKAKDVKSKKKPLPKLPCRKPSLSAHKSQIEIPMPGEVSAPTKQVPSSTTCPPSNVPVHPAVDIIKPVCEDSDNQVSKPQEPLSPHEDISEEAVATVSEYFFDDIFMAVDDE